jgi:putative hydrolase of HD superfamily
MPFSLPDLLPFLHEIDRLKQVERQTVIMSGGRRENSAEHSWQLAVAALLFRDFAPEGCDVDKSVKLALLHDIVEIDAGDTFVYADHSGKAEKEFAALKRLMGLLPESLAAELSELWLEFETGTSPEAKYVRALDRFLPMYANYLNNGYSWRNHAVTLSQIEARNRPDIQAGIPELWATAKAMVEEAIARGDIVSK